MNWFRKHLKHGSRLALLALAVQFALSFGHFHAAVAQTAQLDLTDRDLAVAVTLSAPEALTESGQPQPSSNHDTDRQTSDCAICAVLSLASNFLFATPPLLELPQAVELLHVTTGAEFAHLGSLHPPFQSRAPPAS
ncbi:DUF2946 family protein [Bradyrhizobium sp. CB3481]|uniref:DUF2946 family protein n=1 Tax=Bradyrhizobium sp. CB3481 TaxID=3039158 RepID=UPI0024B07551|nr:DUF2946 family protein [Bradyrhizobium sp. CB3481]WFU15601.1 DUF2946 family protein [Bradyrhizobium sp. CB3481]